VRQVDGRWLSLMVLVFALDAALATGGPLLLLLVFILARK